MAAGDTLLQAFEPLRLRYLDSPLPGWLRAAGDALLGLLPAGLRRQLGVRYQRLLLGFDGEGNLQLRALSEDQSTLVGSVPTDDPELLEQLRARLDENAGNTSRWLLVDIDQTLRPVLTVPASAEPRLREVMAHEIDRQTPFAADQVTFEPRVLARDAASRQLRVELVVLPRQRLDAALARLGPMADGLAGVDVVSPGGALLGVNLLPLVGRAARPDRARAANRWLAVIAVAAILASMLLALDNRQAALDASVAQLATATTQAREVRRLRSALQGSVSAANFLAQERARQPTTLEVLADLTRRLPDHTSLEKIAINDGNVVLIGHSEQASGLVGVLQDSTLIERPTLTGSVQKDPRNGKDRFTLTAVVAGSEADKEAANGPRRP